MRTIAAIRTNKWTEEEERLLAALRPSFGEDVVVVFHDRPAGVTPPAAVIDVNAQWVLQQGLALVPDWGWRCGDYFYYALRGARPDYDFYWLVEPDLHFTSPPADFFAAFALADDDALGYQLGPFRQDIRFARGLPGMDHHRAIFALTRFSGRALDRLFDLRRRQAEGHVSTRDYANDELFCFSHVVADGTLRCGRLEDYAPEWFEGSQVTPDPDLLYDLVVAQAPVRKIVHPVRSRANYVRALAKRLASNTGILMRIREAIDALSVAEVEEVVQQAASQHRDAIMGIKSLRARRRERLARK